MRWLENLDPDLIRLYKYFLSHKARIAFAVVFLMGSASMSSLTATLLGKLLDMGFYNQDGSLFSAACSSGCDIALCRKHSDEHHSDGSG